jgi:hypothetical protein
VDWYRGALFIFPVKIFPAVGSQSEKQSRPRVCFEKNKRCRMRINVVQTSVGLRGTISSFSTYINNTHARYVRRM